MQTELKIDDDVKELGLKLFEICHAASCQQRAPAGEDEIAGHVQSLLNTRLKENAELKRQRDEVRLELDTIYKADGQQLLSQALAIERMKKILSACRAGFKELSSNTNSIFAKQTLEWLDKLMERSITAPPSDTLREIRELLLKLELHHRHDCYEEGEYRPFLKDKCPDDCSIHIRKQVLQLLSTEAEAK